MRQIRWLLLIALAGLLPQTALAVDMDFYTWNAFEETVSAFQRVALVLRDPGFTVFVLVFAVGGILIGGLLVGVKGIKGEKVNPIGFLIPALIGVALFRAFIWPTGTLFIYDPVRNDTAAVGDVPDAVVLMAGMLNKIERGVREIVETAAADPAAERAGALRSSLVLNAVNARGTNLGLERNLVNYYMDCGLPAMSLGYNGASQREAERATQDLYTTFARFAHPSLATYAYTGTGDATATMSCQTMWTDVLNPVLGGAAGLAEVRDMVCARTGFDMTVPVQQARCDEELTDISTLFGVTTATDWLPFIRSSQIAVGMTNAVAISPFSRAR
jgi:conjugal transfer mating pair stabilization protein TraG